MLTSRKKSVVDLVIKIFPYSSRYKVRRCHIEKNAESFLMLNSIVFVDLLQKKFLFLIYTNPTSSRSCSFSIKQTL